MKYPMNERGKARKELSLLSAGLIQADKKIILVLAQRASFVRRILLWKMRYGQPIIRKNVEKQRIARILRLARPFGHDPGFIRALYYLVIAESCRIQLELKESGEFPKEHRMIF